MGSNYNSSPSSSVSPIAQQVEQMSLQSTELPPFVGPPDGLVNTPTESIMENFVAPFCDEQSLGTSHPEYISPRITQNETEIHDSFYTQSFY
jgi:hypothetical protein